MKHKRRNLARWNENRLRRLTHKLAQFDVSATKTSPFNDFSPESIARCRERRNALGTSRSV